MNINISDANAGERERCCQWEAAPEQPMPDAEAVLRRCRWKVHAITVAGWHYRAWAEFFKVKDGGHVILQRCLIDTSNRVEGILLRQRYTYYFEMHFVGCSVLLTPYEPPPAASSPGSPPNDGEVSHSKREEF